MWKRTISSGHNFSHVMTAQLSWHVQNYALIEALELDQKQYSQDFNYELINH